MAELKILNLKKEYEKGKTAVDDFTLTIRDGELAVIVGPSGCGKSTTLRMIAGLVPATSGRIILDGRDISEVSTRERDIAMVFQNYALYENMTVFGNIAFPLKIRKEEKEKIREKVTGISKILKIEDLLDRRPKTLSGGEKQRVAMGRALVRNPKLFLMDEPPFQSGRSPQDGAEGRNKEDTERTGDDYDLCNPRSGRGHEYSRHYNRHGRRKNKADRNADRDI